MTYNEACKMACAYFDENLGFKPLATATENAEKWFFSAGSDSANLIGNTIISVSKHSGEVGLVDILSDSGFEEVRNSTPLEVPREFRRA